MRLNQSRPWQQNSCGFLAHVARRASDPSPFCRTAETGDGVIISIAFAITAGKSSALTRRHKFENGEPNQASAMRPGVDFQGSGQSRGCSRKRKRSRTNGANEANKHARTRKERKEGTNCSSSRRQLVLPRSFPRPHGGGDGPTPPSVSADWVAWQCLIVLRCLRH
jgi:hypothetical protein